MMKLNKLVLAILVSAGVAHGAPRTGAANPFITQERMACYVKGLDDSSGKMVDEFTSEIVDGIFSVEDGEKKGGLLQLFEQEMAAKPSEAQDRCAELEEALEDFLTTHFRSYRRYVGGEAQPTLALSLDGSDAMSRFLGEIAKMPAWQARDVSGTLLPRLNKLLEDPATTSAQAGQGDWKPQRRETRSRRVSASRSSASAPKPETGGAAQVYEVPFTLEELEQQIAADEAAERARSSWVTRVRRCLPRREAIAPLTMAGSWLLAAGMELYFTGGLSQVLQPSWVAPRVLAKGLLAGFCVHAACELGDRMATGTRALKAYFSRKSK